MSRHEVMTRITTIHQRWGQLQRHKSKLDIKRKPEIKSRASVKEGAEES